MNHSGRLCAWVKLWWRADVKKPPQKVNYCCYILLFCYSGTNRHVFQSVLILVTASGTKPACGAQSVQQNFHFLVCCQWLAPLCVCYLSVIWRDGVQKKANCYNFTDALTFHLAPWLGQRYKLLQSKEKVNHDADVTKCCRKIPFDDVSVTLSHFKNVFWYKYWLPAKISSQ